MILSLALVPLAFFVSVSTACRDLYHDCSKIKQHCSPNYEWMMLNCANTCGVCKELCIDSYTDCSWVKSNGYCNPSSQFYTWAKQNCIKTCGIQCTPPACVDRDATYCASKATNCNAGRGWNNYLRYYCPKTCKTCNSGGNGGGGGGSGGGATKCGIKGSGHTRIVGGTNARPGDWPWQVQIDRTTDHMRVWCGGTVINDEWIVSAAHCFERDTRVSSYAIYLGEHDLQSGSQHEQKLEIAEIIMHPKYQSRTYEKDIALIRLKKKASFNTHVRPACFPDSSVKFYDGEECYVTGWGYLREGGSSPRILQQVKVPLVPRSTCRQSYGHNSITGNMICAGYPQGGKDACQGDSGGPLVCKKRNSSGQDVWYLWGVVSWGRGCASPRLYGVYSNMETLGSWATQTMRSRS
ncbi:chymotrypsinogen A-like [Clytia hemisphaerica]